VARTLFPGACPRWVDPPRADHRSYFASVAAEPPRWQHLLELLPHDQRQAASEGGRVQPLQAKAAVLAAVAGVADPSTGARSPSVAPAPATTHTGLRLHPARLTAPDNSVRVADLVYHLRDVT
jgi:hypothetical protein